MKQYIMKESVLILLFVTSVPQSTDTPIYEFACVRSNWLWFEIVFCFD